MKRFAWLPLLVSALAVAVTGLAFAAYGRADLQALWQLAYSLCR